MTAFMRNSIIYNIYMSLVYYIYVIQRVFKVRYIDYGNYHYITRVVTKIEAGKHNAK
jgi:hypothetical protein